MRKYIDHVKMFRVVLSIVTGMSGTALLVLSIFVYSIESGWPAFALLGSSLCNFAVSGLSLWDFHTPPLNTGMDKEDPER